MFRKAWSFCGPLVIALSAVLFSAETSHAAPPVGGSRPGNGFRPGGGHHGGGSHHHHGRRFIWVAPWWYGNSYWYYSPEYVYALAGQQSQAAQLQQQWYRLRQDHSELVRDRQAQALAARAEAKLERQSVERRAPAPVVELTPEARASAKFKLAMILAAEGQQVDAADFCRDILKKYPGTPAARQAQQFLDQVAQR